MASEMFHGFLVALGVILGGFGSMWLLFAFVHKFGGMGHANWQAHNVEDIGTIDRHKMRAFAERQREADRQPFVDTYEYPEPVEPHGLRTEPES